MTEGIIYCPKDCTHLRCVSTVPDIDHCMCAKYDEPITYNIPNLHRRIDECIAESVKESLEMTSMADIFAPQEDE